MKTSTTRGFTSAAIRYSLIGIVSAAGLAIGSATAAIASNTPASPDQAPALHVTIIPDQGPIYLAPGLTQGVASVTVQASGGSGYLNICVNHGGNDVPIALTPVAVSHQQIPVYLSQPNTVKLFWAPLTTGGIALSCSHSDEVLVASDELQVFSAGHLPCILCVSSMPGVVLGLDR